MDNISVKIVNTSGHALPSYATVSSAGMDVRAHLSEPVVLGPLERALIPTGLRVQLPEGYEMQLRPRSGLALKHGITLVNTPGTIDADYRGEIGVILVNLSVPALYSQRWRAHLPDGDSTVYQGAMDIDRDFG